MNPNDVVGALEDAVRIAVRLSLPVILVAMIVGLVISVFQAATQIQEQTLTSVPKIVAIYIVIVATGASALVVLQNFTISILAMLPEIGR
jgi:flagellar biosynthetic protein FliQ